MDRAFGFEPKGREFESLRAHHFIFAIIGAVPITWARLNDIRILLPYQPISLKIRIILSTSCNFAAWRKRMLIILLILILLFGFGGYRLGPGLGYYGGGGISLILVIVLILLLLKVIAI